MSNNKKYHKKKSNAVVIDAQFRIKIEKDIENFVANHDERVYEFPANLTNVERAFVHNLAPKYNLKTKSNGKGKKISRFVKLKVHEISRCF
jgi:R3H domain